jgi:GNAT superfamily N-acetyltransferase
MNAPYSHIVAKHKNDVVAFALVMLKNIRNEIPGLDNLFNEIKSIKWNSSYLSDYRYFIMGQVCVDQPYRKMGVFRALFQKMAEEMKHDFDFIITEIDDKNQRSLNAHLGIGFLLLRKYTWPNGETWNIVGLRIGVK